MSEIRAYSAYPAEEIANAQLHALTLNRFAIRRALNLLKPDHNGLYTLVKDSECDRFLSDLIKAKDEDETAQTRFAVRIHCRPRCFCFTATSFEEAVAYAAPFETLFSITIVAF